MLPPLTLRLRMILLFCVVISVFLAGTYVVVYASFVREIERSFDDRLLDISRTIAAELAADSKPHLQGHEVPGQLLALVSENGDVMEASQSFRDAHVLITNAPFSGQASLRTFATVAGKFRAAMVPASIRGQPRWLIVAESANEDRREADFRERAFGLWTVSLLLATLIAAWYAGRSLQPIVDLNRHVALLIARASRASHEDLDISLPIANPHDELGILARNFNVLFLRLSAVVRQLRQFVSDAAHELRTPLSVVRGETQFLLAQRRSSEEYEVILRTIDSELTVMVRMIEGLFTLSMADAGQLELQSELLQLDEVLDEACGLAAPRARRKGIQIQQVTSMATPFSGDQALLRQVFLTLLDNAVKYSPPNTTVHISLTRSDGHPQATIADQGPGIAAEHLEHIFERFYRAAPQSSDEARSGGLGLAIAKAIMQAHGGEIRCHSQPGKGSTFTLIFPAEGEAHPQSSVGVTGEGSVPQHTLDPVF